MKFKGKTGEIFEMLDVDATSCHHLKEIGASELLLAWFTSDGNSLTIDAKPYTFDNNQIICLTEFHKIDFTNIKSLKLLKFNRPFYCILDHDSEVGCKGALFFGASSVPVLLPNTEEIEILDAVWKMAIIELNSSDNLQLEMLQMMLKRLLILCTRVYKKQHNIADFDSAKVDLIRSFNFLVESNFKNKHTVAEYADLLNKSPKTIANIFSKFSTKSPLQYIHERIMLEARRLIVYTDKPIAEVGYDLGFADIQTFSRFFKKNEGDSPTEFKEKMTSGKIANS
jgi:AraC family transcriptional regulator, transcriptional activator of pobA